MVILLLKVKSPSLEETGRNTELDLSELQKIADYFKKVRFKYSEFEGSLKG